VGVVFVVSQVGCVGASGCVGVAWGGGSAGWVVESFASPTSFSAGVVDSYVVSARNVGSVATPAGAGSGVVRLTDVLPGGVSLREEGVQVVWPGVAKLLGVSPETNLFEVFKALEGLGLAGCSLSVGSVSCWVSFGGFEGFGLCSVAACSVLPDEEIRLVVPVLLGEPVVAGSLTNSVSVSGGGVAGVSSVSVNPVGVPVGFGPASFDFRVGGLDGGVDRQAGDHPYELMVTGGFVNGPRREYASGVSSVQDPKDVVVDLPVGFVGSILATPQCSFSELSSHVSGGRGGCPADTVVGHIKTFPVSGSSIDGPVYNMTPERGVAAEFAYVDLIAGPHVFYARVVPTPRGYVLETVNPDVPQIALTQFVVTFYGDPAAKQEELAALEGKAANPIAPVAFFTNPTDCAGEEPTATIYMDSWQHPARLGSDGTPVDLGEEAGGRRLWASAQSKSPPVIGCDALRFPARVGVQPTTREADKPSGLNVEVGLPQAETVGVPGTPTLKRAVVRFPEGFSPDPASGDGLAACSEAQIGWEEGVVGSLKFNAAPPACPEASKIGVLELESPLINRRLEGEMFLASQDANPFHSTIAAYVVVHDPVTGVLVKIAGEVQLDPHTGRMTAVFDENPNLPFSDLKLHFFGGPRAEFATPEACGTFTTSTELFPYSFPDSGPPATPFDVFLISEACPGGFSPSFTAGSGNLQAGAYTPFIASFARSDSDQELAGLTVTLPPGLLGKITGVTLCSQTQIHEAETGAGGCPASSRVGSVTAGAGPGPNPLFVTGVAYLTGPYNGGPYGLAVAVPAAAGPFNFGMIVVRQSIRIDPRTAQVTDVSDPFPTIIDGIPLRLRRVDLTLDRPQFMFNPTSCAKLSFTGVLLGSPLGAPTTLSNTIGYATQPGASSPFTTPFQITNCATLRFTPIIKVTTKAQASKANGASLHFKISYPAGAMGTQTWFQEAKFTLPKQLPARLETLQRACLSSVFETSRTACPPASRIGTATVHTPVLPEPLTGPVYFVSYGGQKFPEAVITLKGDNVNFELHGETFISKQGITSATFHNTPDVPFENIEVDIPTGRYSEFGANLPPKAHYDFCHQTLTMPTLFKAQNGAETHQNTPITTTGCPKKHHKHTKHTTKHHHH